MIENGKTSRFYAFGYRISEGKEILPSLPPSPSNSIKCGEARGWVREALRVRQGGRRGEGGQVRHAAPASPFGFVHIHAQVFTKAQADGGRSGAQLLFYCYRETTTAVI